MVWRWWVRFHRTLLVEEGMILDFWPGGVNPAF